MDNARVVLITNDGGCIVGDAILEKCFLCDCDFVEGEESWLMFQKRLAEDGQTECSLSAIISSALGRDIVEAEAHSTLLCSRCNDIALEYEKLMQRFCETRYHILSTYNRTAQQYDLDTIAVEINGILQDTNTTDAITMPSAKDFSIDKTENTPEFTNEFDNFELNSYDDSMELIEKVADDNVDVASITIADATNVLDAAAIKYDDLVTLSSVDKDKMSTSVPLLSDLVDNIDADDMITYDDIIEQMSSKASVIDENIEDNIESSQSMPDDDEDYFYNTDNDYVAVDDDATIINAELQQSTMIEQKGETYCCLSCEPHEYLPALSFSEHMLATHNTNIYICNVCSNIFLRQKDLKNHLKEKHSDNLNADSEMPKFDCDTCPRTFSNYRQFRAHMQLHQNKHNGGGGGNTKHECNICRKKYSTKTLLDEHMNMHTGARPYQCDQCPKNFASKYTLQAHTKIHSERQRPYQCDICDKRFLNQANLAQHKKLHVNSKSFVCEFCSKTFSTQHNLDVHKIAHTGLRPFICRTCGKAFARRAEVRDHERIHTGERPFKCEICDMAFAQRSNLLSHKKSTHLNERLHKCDECNRTFKRRRLLEYHMNAAHRGVRPFKCDLCTAAFVYPEHFKKHVLIHTGKKPYPCEVCGKEFNSRDNRNAHRFVHSDKKPYECLECGAGFMRKPLLLAHMKHTNHANDTFIVNQPQITKHIDSSGVSDSAEINFSSDLIIHSDGSKAVIVNAEEEEGEEEEQEEEAEVEVEDGGESFERMLEQVQNILPDVESDAVVHDLNDASVIASVNGQLIKDQMGEVKYLQFEDLDRDGHQTLTWVDIAGDKD